MQYKKAKDFISEYELTDFTNEKKVARYVTFFNLDRLCKPLDEDQMPNGQLFPVSLSIINLPNEDISPYRPVFGDLCRLHYIVLSNKMINVLEFGSGFSSVVISHALMILKNEFHSWANENLRSKDPFKLFSVDENEYFSNLTTKRIGVSLQEYASISSSNVTLKTHDSRYCTFFDNVPNVSPDFILLDGPDQYAAKDSINGFQISDAARMPMSADILGFEFFLNPGTLILVDGRTANVRFLKQYLKRNWIHTHDVDGDVHYLVLNEDPFGAYSKSIIDFKNNN
ncbi:hypothetical protein OAD25_03150 [Gammaproteobacteria bacterium]|nr:hypothetical protein [Gammaproteobacteria bacterium]